MRGRKSEGREVAMAAHQRGRSDESDDGGDASSSEDEQPARAAQIEKKKRRTATVDDDQRRARVALAATTRCLATSALFYGKLPLLLDARRSAGVANAKAALWRAET